MRTRTRTRIALACCAVVASTAAAMRPHRPGGLQDLAAFPKYEVVFLNDHPLAESDAARMQAEGLWNDDDFVDLRPRSRARATIEGGEAEGEEGEKATDKGEEGQAETPRAEPLELLTLHYTHKGNTGPHAYLCALPSANRTGAQTSTLAETHPEPESDAAASWLALSHLDGKCLYWREPWFTYAYCHNRYMRQFREAQQTAPSPPEGYTPKEDPTYPGYTLGHAHPPKRKGRKGTDVAATEQTATFGTGPASRYLVQTWTDGTRCDKSGQPREVKVEVHCSMTAGDHIYMVKEIDTCKYVVVIHSPHLCSLPGFRPQTADDIVPVPIRCREIVTDDEFERWEAEPKPDPAEQLRIAADRAAEEAAEAVVGKEDPAEPPAFKHKEGDSKVDGDLIKRLEEILQNAFADQLIDVSMLDLEQSEEDVVDSFVIETAEGEDRRAMLERLQRAIQEELAGGEARVVVRDEL